MIGGVLQDGGDRRALAGPSRDGCEGLGQLLRLISEGEPDAALAPIHGQESAAAVHPCCIDAKNSLLVLVRFIRSSRNSIASTGGMSARKFRSR